jgi:FdhE protein
MAGGFLDRLLGRRPPGPEVQTALAALDRAAAERPSLAGPLGLLRELLPPLYDRPTADIPLSLTPELAAAKLAGGVPLLRGEPAPVDGRRLRRNLGLVCDALAARPGGEAAQALGRALHAGRLEAGELLAEALAGRPEALSARAEAQGVDGALTASALRLSAFPLLERLAATLAALRSGAPWGGGDCPTCGGGPLLGELRGLEQERWLRCGWCATGWAYPRLACPRCGNRDHRTLGWLQVEGDMERGRVAVCEACRGGLKTLATLSPLTGPALLAADAATLHLDLAAAQHGYLLV